ncbi:hypothetical protein BDA99DRAFT_61938 [Phascolomyces articulosus]|uniref:Transmembrane protein n=1 Tax=Phascolomyces articulosus TaxID=60185 RepID=A0AAD5PFM8_9FUNG|nr:hypothetical protein BDA99DRAFT_61938 [Phascolomyces articulosus]
MKSASCHPYHLQNQSEIFNINNNHPSYQIIKFMIQKKIHFFFSLFIFSLHIIFFFHLFRYIFSHIYCTHTLFITTLHTHSTKQQVKLTQTNIPASLSLSFLLLLLFLFIIIILSPLYIYYFYHFIYQFIIGKIVYYYIYNARHQKNIYT